MEVLNTPASKNYRKFYRIMALSIPIIGEYGLL